MSILQSFETLLTTVLGKFSKDVAIISESILGSLVFMLFSVIVAFILLNLFISVLNQTQTMVKKNSHLAPYDAELMEHMGTRFREWFSFLFPKEKGI